MPPSRVNNTGRILSKFALKEVIKTEVKEASDVTTTPSGSFLVVSDTSKKLVCLQPDGVSKKWPLEGIHEDDDSQFEGVAFDASSKTLFVSREEDREILFYNFQPEGVKEPQLVGKLLVSSLDGPKNKGIEGLTFLPARYSPTLEPLLIGAKEDKPRELLLFSMSGAGVRHVPLDKVSSEALSDIAALATCPLTGHIFIVSEEKGTVAEVLLKESGGNLQTECLQTFKLKDRKGKTLARVEGLTFNDKGDLFALTENDGKLHQFSRV